MSDDEGKIKGGYYIKAKRIQESEIAHAPPHVREMWDWLIAKAMWKDGDRLKRGQLVKTYSDIKEGLSWFIGFRKMAYSDDQCETAMKWLMKQGMITKSKTTRGLLITIVNYDKYQNVDNYENQTENRMRTTTKPQRTATIEKKEKEIEERKEEIKPIGETAEPLADAGDEEYKKRMNPEVTEVITFLMEKMSLSKLDKSVPINRRMAYLALKKFGLEQVKAIIEIASQDDYWRSRVTSVGDIYYNGLKIASTKRFAPKSNVTFV